MKVDLFELLEGLFRGIVFFFYNFLETIYVITRSPFRGGLRLSRRHRDQTRRQMSGMTFVFLCYFAACTLALLENYRADVREQKLFTAMYEGSGFDSEILWAALAGSLIAVIIVDAPLRLLLFVRIRGASFRRSLLLSAIQYSLFWPLLILIAPAALPPRMFFSDGAQLAYLAVALPLMALLLLPAANILSQGWRWTASRAYRSTTITRAGTETESKEPEGRRRRVPRLRLAASAGGLGLLLVLATMTAGSLSSELHIERGKSDARRQAPRIAALNLECRLRGGEREVEVVVWNLSRRRIFAFANDVSMAAGNGSGARRFPLESHPDRPGPFQIEPDSLGSIIGRPPAGVEAARGMPCRLAGIRPHLDVERLVQRDVWTSQLHSTWE